MNPQAWPVENPRSAWRGASHASAARAREPDVVAVVVSWAAPAADGAAAGEPQQIELVADLRGGLRTSAQVAWTCRAAPELSWVDVLSRSLSGEVVLTASAQESAAAQQAVFELAGFLTRRLERARPMVRVRFQPSGSAHRRLTRARR